MHSGNRFRLMTHPKNHTHRNFHTKPLAILDRNNCTQGVIFPIIHNGQHRIKNREILHQHIQTTELAHANHYLILHLLPTVVGGSSNQVIINKPHVAGGVFTKDLTIVHGTGISKVHEKELSTPPDYTVKLTHEELIMRQEYVARARFQSDETVAGSIFSTNDGGISKLASDSNPRCIIVVNIEITNIHLQSLQMRLSQEKEKDIIYDRRNNHCGDSAYRVITGLAHIEDSIDTQEAAHRIIQDITEPVDHIFTTNFTQLAASINLISYTENIRLKI